MPRGSVLSTRTIVLIENLATVREIKRCLDGEELRQDLLSLLRGFQNKLPVLLPTAEWSHQEIRKPELELRLIPNGWRVRRNDSLAISLYMHEVLEPAFYDERDDPSVGICVPNNWRCLDKFNKGIKRHLPNGFIHVGECPDCDPDMPIWRYLGLTKHVKRGAFDVDGFYKEAASAVRDLLRKKRQIDALILSVK